jgi:O-antigen/teichoic acid export membrane protein
MRVYAGISIVDNLGILTLTVLFLSMEMGVYSPLLAYAISHGACLMVSMAVIIRDIGIVIPDMRKSREFLRYGVPLAPSETTAWVTQSSDRYIIGFLLGVSAAGIYSAGYTIAAIMPALITPIQVIILPILSKQFDTGRLEEVERYLSKAIEIYLLVAIPAVMGLSVLGREILIHLSSTEYTDGAVVIAPVALGLLCYALFTLLINSSFLMKRTMNVLYINVFAAVINIVLNFVLIDYIGYLGAAIATLLAYATMLLLAFRSTRFDLHLSFQSHLLVKALVAGLLMSAFIYLIPVSDLLSLLLTILVGVIVYGLVLLLFMNRNERASLLTLLVRDADG